MDGWRVASAAAATICLLAYLSKYLVVALTLMSETRRAPSIERGRKQVKSRVRANYIRALLQ